MAYVQDSFLEDEQQQGNGGPVTPGSGTASNAPIDASMAPQAAAASSQKKTPGRFADLGEYLRVNQGQNFGGQVAGKIGQDINQGQQSLVNAQDQFKQRADANTVTDSNNLIGQIGTNPESVDVNSFAKLRDAQYKGPSSLSDTQDLYNQVQGAAGSAVGKANASKTEGGRFALLDSYYGKPSYSQGQKSLDNVLVQNDPKSQQAFDQMRTNANQLQQNVNNAGVQLGNYGAQAKGQTEATGLNARNALGLDKSGAYAGGGAIGNLYDSLQAKSQQAQQGNSAEVSKLQAALSGQDVSGLTPEEINLLGLGDFSGSLYGVDPGANYFRGTESNAFNPGNVASQQDAQRWNALSKLSGNDLSGLVDTSKAGTAPANAGTFDISRFLSDVGSGKSAYNNALTQGSATIGGDGLNTVAVNNELARRFPDRYSAITDPDTQITNGVPGAGSFKPRTFTNLNQTKQDIESALTEPFPEGTSPVYIDKVKAALNGALAQINSEISKVGTKFGADKTLKK